MRLASTATATASSRRGLLVALATLPLLWACGGPDAKAPNPKRSLDERRAVEIIIRAFRDEGLQPVPGRRVALEEEGKSLEIDVGASGHKYGVAYVTPNERTRLGAAVPARNASMGDALQLIHGSGDDIDAKILILQDTEYLYDDQVGTEHEATTITAERKLARDVRDFVVRAKAENWP